MTDRLALTLAIADYPFTQSLKTGALAIEGVDARYRTIKPQIAAYRMMVRDLAFDVCELAPTTYLIARAHGVPIIALPIFLMRRFHHGGLRVHPDSGVRTPKDLEGKRVGVRAYSVTTGVWTRFVLANAFGVDISRIHWLVDDEEHVQALVLPDNVEHTAAGRSLYEMMEQGELAAGLDGNAGIGRSGDPQRGWRQEDVSHYPDLFPDAEELEAQWYSETGIYPVHSVLVVKEQLLKDHPWLASSLFCAFEAAKNAWLVLMRSDGVSDPLTARYRRLTNIVGPDPLPFGLDANLASIAALHDAALQQGLIPGRMALEEMFVDVA